MDFECKIQDVRPAITVAIRFLSSEATITADLTHFLPRVQDFLLSRGERPAGFPYVCIYAMDAEGWHMECGFPVAHPIPGEGSYVASSIPGGRCATTMHRGHMYNMGQSYARLKKWMEDQGLAAKGPLYEIAMNDPRCTPPEDIYAGLMIPV